MVLILKSQRTDLSKKYLIVNNYWFGYTDNIIIGGKMTDFLTRGYIATQNFAGDMVDKVRRERNAERGDIVQTILIIAIFVVIVIVVGGILYNAIKSKGNQVGDCISNNGAGSGTTGAPTNC